MKNTLYKLYERQLWLQAKTWRIPAHLGIILDGNRRFARELGAAVAVGHGRGADKLDEVLSWCERAGVNVVSVWAFSIDNFQRSAEEVETLMGLFEKKFIELLTNHRVHRDQIRVRAFGRIELLPERVRTAIRAVEIATQHYTRRTLNVGLAYGGREEILDAFGRFLRDREAKGLTPSQIADTMTEDGIEPFLYTAHVPHPDLIIRTSGEVRLSGFMLWQSAYSELFFCDTHWPAFREVDFLRALRSYNQRQRRFGK